MDEGFYLAHYFLGLICVEQSLYEQALGEFERAVAISGGSSESISALGYALGRAGNRDGAKLQLEELTKRSAQRYVSPVLLAQVNAGLEDYDKAISNLEDAFKVRSTDLVWLNIRPAFDAIRQNDRTIRILDNLGLRTPASR
jgi:tetratricopeptide (TPR) repeat protein